LKKNEVYKISPKIDSSVNGNLISDRARFYFDFNKTNRVSNLVETTSSNIIKSPFFLLASLFMSFSRLKRSNNFLTFNSIIDYYLFFKQQPESLLKSYRNYFEKYIRKSSTTLKEGVKKPFKFNSLNLD